MVSHLAPWAGIIGGGLTQIKWEFVCSDSGAASHEKAARVNANDVKREIVPG